MRDEMHRYQSQHMEDFEAGRGFGTPGCQGCRSRHAKKGYGYVQLPGLKSHAEEDCLYCSLLYHGLLRLIPDIETRYGYDAQVVFNIREDGTLRVSADSNGSLKGREKPKSLWLDYEYYTVDENQQNRPALDTSSEESFTRARQWISNCFRDHALCGADEPSLLPTRILDIGEGPTADPTYVKLIEEPGRKERYISISHSWGGQEPLTTTTTTLPDHKRGIAFNRLPRTFQDSIRIARRLGIRYLWIDSLCIIQDSTEDWEVEGSRMALIYRNSWLTLSATLSSSPITGCFNFNQATTVQAPNDIDNTLAILFPQAAKLRQDLRLYLRFSIAHPDFKKYSLGRDNTPFPLLDRAWGYQERMLAPRVLHFGPQELFWECMQDLDCECGTLKWSEARHMSGYINRDTSGQLPPKISHYASLYVGAIRSGPDDAARQKKLLLRWGDMVEEFTERSLTFPTDRLPAFSGVAAETAERLPMEYCAGLWKESLPAGLLWRARLLPTARSIGESLIAPSWSWAAANVPVEYRVFPSRPWEDCAEVEEVRCVPSGRDPRGQLRLDESYIILSADVVAGSLCFQDGMYRHVNDEIEAGDKFDFEKPKMFSVKVGNHEPVMVHLDRKVWDQNGDWVWQRTDELYCAKIAKENFAREQDLHHWLVLRLRKGESAYERIGLISNLMANWNSQEPKRRIKII